MKKKVFIIAILLTAGSLFAWKYFRGSDFLYAGTVEATEVDISPQVNTTIAEVFVKEGDTVSKGQPLVSLTGDDIKLAAQIAERDLARALKLHTSGSMPDETFDRIRFKRDDAALRASWCIIASPLTGTVLHRYHEPGELVNPSMKLLTLADLSEVYAYIYVPQNMLAKISLNIPLEGVIPELDGKKIPGRISFIRQDAEFTPKNVQTREERTRLVYGVKVAFPNKEGLLKPGMTVEVRLPK